MITDTTLIEEARQLVVWYKQPSGYQAADTEIGPKVDRAFELLGICVQLLLNAGEQS